MTAGDPFAGAVPVPRRGTYLRQGELANGFRVAARAIEPGDRDALARGFGTLSEESRFRRFLAGTSRLSGPLLDALVDVDGTDRVGVLLVWPRTSQDDVLLGEGRFIRLPGDPEAAEAAVTVADAAQGLGAGRFVIRLLADLALERGITRFAATMSPSNEAALRMMASVGTVTDDTFDGTARTVVIALR